LIGRTVREGKRVGGAEMAASIIAAFERRGIEATPPQPSGTLLQGDGTGSNCAGDGGRARITKIWKVAVVGVSYSRTLRGC
jgi:hypothetical protein